MYARTVRIAGTASLALCLAVALGAPAQAHSATPATGHKGTCTGSSTVKLAASGHKKGIKVTAKVKTGTADEAWLWTITDNGVPVAGDVSSTNGNGTLVVRQEIANADGSDTIDFAATDTVTGEVCTAEVTV